MGLRWRSSSALTCFITQRAGPGWKQGEGKCSPDRSSMPSAEVPHQLAQVTGSTGSCPRRRQGAGGSLSVSCHTSPSFKTPVTLAASGVRPVSRDTACRSEGEGEDEASRCHRRPARPAPRRPPPDRARGASQPFVEAISAALITSAVWIALLGH